VFGRRAHTRRTTIRHQRICYRAVTRTYCVVRHQRLSYNSLPTRANTDRLGDDNVIVVRALHGTFTGVAAVALFVRRTSTTPLGGVGLRSDDLVYSWWHLHLCMACMIAALFHILYVEEIT
jgi:hypothetical protein